MSEDAVTTTGDNRCRRVGHQSGLPQDPRGPGGQRQDGQDGRGGGRRPLQTRHVRRRSCAARAGSRPTTRRTRRVWVTASSSWRPSRSQRPKRWRVVEILEKARTLGPGGPGPTGRREGQDMIQQDTTPGCRQHRRQGVAVHPRARRLRAALRGHRRCHRVHGEGRDPRRQRQEGRGREGRRRAHQEAAPASRRVATSASTRTPRWCSKPMGTRGTRIFGPWAASCATRSS